MESSNLSHQLTDDGQPHCGYGQEDRYEIRVAGYLETRWSEWFDGMAIAHLEGGETLLTGPVTDQSALHGLLNKIRDVNLKLISVQKL